METCKSIIVFGDDQADNTATFHCKLPLGHEGEHAERGEMESGEDGKQPYLLTWTGEHQEFADDETEESERVAL